MRDFLFLTQFEYNFFDDFGKRLSFPRLFMDYVIVLEDPIVLYTKQNLTMHSSIYMYNIHRNTYNCAYGYLRIVTHQKGKFCLNKIYIIW